MCGIIGFTGKERAVPYLLEGLNRLEYRGYDSAGLALNENGHIKVTKTEGRLSVLESLVVSEKQSGCTVGIGHTRWATHGAPSEENAHPHLSKSGTFAVVHNGIIENYRELKAELLKEGYPFYSETDTEVIPHLFEKYYDGNLIECAARVRGVLRGAYALCVLSSYHPDELLCIRYGSPLVVGQGDTGCFVASDTLALNGYVTKICKPCAEETVVLTPDKIRFFDKNGNEAPTHMTAVSKNTQKAEKGTYSHYMLKEIMEQPEAVEKTVSSFIKDGDILLPCLEKTGCRFSKIHIVACGSAYHAGLSGKYIIEKLCGISVNAEIASEFRYRNVPISRNDLCIVISQSGETADSISALKIAKEKGCPVLGIVNVRDSTVADLSDFVIYTSAGPEIAVATTKAYSAQLAVLHGLAVYLASRLGRISDEKKQEYISSLVGLPPLIRRTLDKAFDKVRTVSLSFTEKKEAFFIGRGTDYPVALEAALKLKEISYIHAEAYPAGELKHGTISLVEAGTTIVALMSDRDVFSKTESNVREVKARGARIIAVTTEDKAPLFDENDICITVPHCNSLVSPCLEIIPLQLLSYFTAVNRSCDVDKPRNLAKSVTVE